MRKHLSRLAAAAAFGGAALALTATSASAYIVCNPNDGVCWHTHRQYAYAPEYGVVVHPDGWAWGPGEHYVWREHPGRGYWRGGVWISF